MKYILIFLVIFSVFSLTANKAIASNYMTGSELKKLCFSKFDTDYGRCFGFITGVADMLLVTKINNNKPCHRTSVRSQQLVDIVINYMNANPSLQRKPAREIISIALTNAFPCAN